MKTTLKKTSRKASRKPARRNLAMLPPRGKAAPKTIVNNRQLLSTTANGSLAAFNPALPENGALIIAGVLRDQLNSLFALIQSVPAGPPGPQGVPGIQGPPFANAVIDGVTTLLPGEQAWVTASFDGTDVHFAFGIPRGDVGVQGQQGGQGEQGVPGIQGPAFAQAVVDGVTTLPAGYPAWVQSTFDGTYVHFSFGIPHGDPGPQGEQGAPGQVTAAELSAAISITSNNTNGVATMDTPFTNDPPTLADMELMRAKYNELVLAARR